MWAIFPAIRPLISPTGLLSLILDVVGPSASIRWNRPPRKRRSLMKKRQIRPNHADILLAPFLAASQLGAQLIQKLRLQSFACELRRLFRIVRLPLFVRKLTANSVSPNRF